jgi:hypothetical protein
MKTAMTKLKMPQQQINGAKSTDTEAKTATMPSVVSFSFFAAVGGDFSVGGSELDIS